MLKERYDRLSKFYNTYWGSFCLQYVPLVEQYLYEKEHKTDILDLACGTGLLSKMLAQKGHNVVGLDLSKGMLEEANRCNDFENLQFVQGNMSDFKLEKKFDLVICSFDSINYLLTKQEVRAMLDCVGNVLKPKGLFLFDFNTDKTYIKFNGCSFEKVFEEQKCIHSLEYNEEKKIATTTFSFSDGIIEKHLQRPYSLKDMTDLLAASSYEIKEIYTNFNKKQFAADSERIFILANKVVNH